MITFEALYPIHDDLKTLQTRNILPSVKANFCTESVENSFEMTENI